MTRFSILMAVALLCCGAIFSAPATAQYYAPGSPPISPWMGLWQKNTGALDNYHSFVLPQMQLNQTLQMQNNALHRQAAGLQYLSDEMMQPRGYSPGMMRSTGQGATFLNYSHYYGGGNQAAQVHPQVSNSVSIQAVSQSPASKVPSRASMPR